MESQYANETDDDSSYESRNRTEEGSKTGAKTVNHDGRLLGESLTQKTRTVTLDEFHIVLE